MGVKWCLIVVLIFISLVTNDVEHLFMYLGHLHVLLGEMSTQIFCPVLNWIVLLLLSCRNCSYILHILFSTYLCLVLLYIPIHFCIFLYFFFLVVVLCQFQEYHCLFYFLFHILYFCFKRYDGSFRWIPPSLPHLQELPEEIFLLST